MAFLPYLSATKVTMGLLLVTIYLVALATSCVPKKDKPKRKCYDCNDCKDTNISEIKQVTCSLHAEESCMKVVVQDIKGPKVARRCLKSSICTLGLIERTCDKYWKPIIKSFRPTLDSNKTRVYCCDDDYCNDATYQLPSVLAWLVSSLSFMHSFAY